jgi:carbonic anhydrase
MSACISPIKFKTNLAKSESSSFICNYYEGDCTTKNETDCIKLKYAESDQKSNIVYKGDTYVLKNIIIYRQALHTVNDFTAAAELFMIHRNLEKGVFLCICVPVSSHIKDTSFGNLLKAVPFTVNNFQSPKTFIPTGAFYSYMGSNIYQCDVKVEYIVFASSNLKITNEELERIPKHALFKQYEGPIDIYKHSQSVSFADDKLYIDCKPIDAPDSDDSSGPKIPDANNTAKSINFSDLQNNKFVQMFLMFVVFMIVMVIFFYSYEFTTGMFRELTKSVKGAMPT